MKVWKMDFTKKIVCIVFVVEKFIFHTFIFIENNRFALTSVEKIAYEPNI